MRRRRSYSGIATDSEDALRFVEMAGVRPMIEKLPLEKAAEGYARMMSGKARFRAVLKTISVALGSSEQILRLRGIAGTRLLLRVLRT